jgi:ribonuclease HI
MVYQSLTSIPNASESKSRNHGYYTCIRGSTQKYDELDGYPRLYTRIYSDSKYAVGCITDGSTSGYRMIGPILLATKLLIETLLRGASDLDDEVSYLGPVEYIWISRKQNEDADRYCYQALDRQYGGYRNMDDHGREDYDMDDSD